MYDCTFLVPVLAKDTGCTSLQTWAHLSTCEKCGYLLGPSCLVYVGSSVLLMSIGYNWFSVCCLLRMRVKKLPMILALHLKRFKYMEQLHRYTKLSYRVVFPLELRLFNTSSDAVNLDRMYDLVAVVVHCGR